MASPVQLSFLSGHSGTPRWSPDSRRIAFDASVNGNADIYVMDAAAERRDASPHILRMISCPVGRPMGVGSTSLRTAQADPRSGGNRRMAGKKRRLRIGRLRSAGISGRQGALLSEAAQPGRNLASAARGWSGIDSRGVRCD
jgi:WD40-like Beta Propeller Repeat